VDPEKDRMYGKRDKDIWLTRSQASLYKEEGSTTNLGPSGTEKSGRI